MTDFDALKSALETINSNPEMMAALVKKSGNKLTLDAEGLSKEVARLNLRGAAIKAIAHNTSFSNTVPEATEENSDPQSAQGIFCDTVFSFAADMAAGVNKKTTSGHHRITIITPNGKFTGTLEPGVLS